MRILPRFALTLVGALWGVTSVDAAPTATGESTLPPELAALLDALPKWSTSVAVRAGYGFKDNLLLSYAGEERSAFARGGVEFIALRVPQDRFEYSFYAEAERTHYFSAKTSDTDAKVWIRTVPAYRVGENMKVGFPVTAYYSDQVFDVSDTDAERRVAEFKVRGAMAGPTFRWDFHPSWWTEVQAVGQRKSYDDHANDSRVGEGSVALAWHRLSWLELRGTGSKRWTRYDRRQQYSSAGRELDGTILRIDERELEARGDITWDRTAQWRSSTAVGLMHYRDNGPGYFNYREQKVDQDVEWKNDLWLLRVGGTASRFDYGVRKVGLGIDPPARVKDEFTASLNGERRVGLRWTLLATYRWERTRSNDLFASYTVNEGWLGLRWSWEK